MENRLGDDRSPDSGCLSRCYECGEFICLDKEVMVAKLVSRYSTEKVNVIEYNYFTYHEDCYESIP